jgi:hypothetical protein
MGDGVALKGERFFPAREEAAMDDDDQDGRISSS